MIEAACSLFMYFGNKFIAFSHRGGQRSSRLVLNLQQPFRSPHMWWLTGMGTCSVCAAATCALLAWACQLSDMLLP